MNKEQFITNVKNDVTTNKPHDWRLGQAVFNYIDDKYYPLSREIQFKHRVDCFYDDSQIDEFLSVAFDLLSASNSIR